MLLGLQERTCIAIIIVSPALHYKSALVPRLRAFHCNQCYIG